MSRLALLLSFFIAGPACAFDFVSVAEPAVLYDANSLKAKRLFVATRYLPLEQVVVLADWVKVRDSSGKLYWIEKRNVSSKRYVVVTAAQADVHREADTGSGLAFRATKQLGLEWLGNSDGWVRVRHADGSSGYIKSSDVWGD